MTATVCVVELTGVLTNLRIWSQNFKMFYYVWHIYSRHLSSVNYRNVDSVQKWNDSYTGGHMHPSTVMSNSRNSINTWSNNVYIFCCKHSEFQNYWHTAAPYIRFRKLSIHSPVMWYTHKKSWACGFHWNLSNDWILTNLTYAMMPARTQMRTVRMEAQQHTMEEISQNLW